MTKVLFKTFGCSLNKSDTETMQGVLTELGYEMVNDPMDSEVIVLNTCAVKKPTEYNVMKTLKEMEQLHRPIVIAGCMAQAYPEKFDGHGILGPDNIASISEVIEETMHKNPVTYISRQKRSLRTPRIRKNRAVEILPICAGCTGKCKYCIVRQARGEFYSYPEQDILKSARKAILEGAKEIWLTAQDTGCYGKDTGTFLPALLRKIVALEGEFMVRVGMMNPNFAEEMLEDLIHAFQHEKVFKFLHIPVQSGSDKVLKSMGREYNAATFRKVVTEFRKSFQNITIATDVICGYPSETKADFQKTLDLIKETTPEVLNISRFWKREKTEAAKLKQLPGGKTKERSTMLSELFHHISYENNKKWRNWDGWAIVDDKGDDFMARNFAYKPIAVDGKHRLGEKIHVKIVNTTTFSLLGQQIPKPSA